MITRRQVISTTMRSRSFSSFALAMLLAVYHSAVLEAAFLVPMSSRAAAIHVPKSTTRHNNPLAVSQSAPTSSSESTSSAAAASNDDADFKDKCRRLCDERNLPFAAVKNARDLASVANSPVKPNRVYRMGRVGDASEQDIEILLNELGIRTLVDLRSPTELKDDDSLQRKEVFEDYTDILWADKGRGRDGCIRELKKGEAPLKKPFWSRKNGRHADAEDVPIEELCEYGCDDGMLPANRERPKDIRTRKERHFVSLMNEFKYVKGTVSKLRKRDITKAILKSPGAMFSRRVRTSVKKPFLDEINDGGLPMLNELLLRFGAPGIKYVLELVADRDRHPVAFYCTAGKDRTGMVAAIILALCGVKAEDIVEDYTLSANVYAEMNDHKAMVGALSQRNLDPKTFLGAPPHVMKDTLEAINDEYGSVEGYCNWIGFGPEQQAQLRAACMDD